MGQGLRDNEKTKLRAKYLLKNLMELCHLKLQKLTDRIILNEFLKIRYEAHLLNSFNFSLECRQIYGQITLFVEV
jgi:hypothetical protein